LQQTKSGPNFLRRPKNLSWRRLSNSSSESNPEFL
jgi:hypothetical protein